MALPSSSRNGARVIWVVLHTAEGSRRTGDLYGFFDRNQNASSHAGADGYGLSDGWVDINRAAWTLLNGNPRSVNLEMCGFARWSRDQWLSTDTVDGVVNPRAMVRNAALWARRMCDTFGVPRRKLTPAQVGRGESGVLMHWDYSLGTGDGDHWDIGNGFPWDVFFADLNGTTTEDDMPLTSNDGNVPFTVADPENPAHLETHPWADWTGISAYRTGRIQLAVKNIEDKVNADRAELATLRQELADEHATNESFRAAVLAALDGLATGTGYSLEQIADASAAATVAEFKKAGN